MRIFLCLLSSLLVVSCGSTYVEYDFDEQVDFSQYKSYNYDLENPTGLLEFDERRFVKYTDSILQSRGLERTESPHIWIALITDTFESQSRNTLGIGVGGGGGNVGVGVSGGIPIGGREENLRMTLSFYESKNNAIIWEANSESVLKKSSKPMQRDAYFKKLMIEIFKKYPPKN